MKIALKVPTLRALWELKEVINMLDVWHIFFSITVYIPNSFVKILYILDMH